MEFDKIMKKRRLVCIFIVLSIVLVLSLSACSGLLGKSNTQRYYIDIGQVEDASVASIVYNNSISSCVRVITEYSANSRVAGSGFIITSDGYVLTNRHCVVRYPSGSDLPEYKSDKPLSATYYVVFADSTKQHPATLVNWCTTADIAVLKINDAKDGTYEHPMEFETEQEIYPGQKVYTIGNPDDIGLMLSELMVASPSMRFAKKDENDKLIEDQFDSVVLDGNINHGNSGGPLINVYGRVSGIVYARIDGSKNDMYGLGCAIPTNEIIKYLSSIKNVKINYKTNSEA